MSANSDEEEPEPSRVLDDLLGHLGGDTTADVEARRDQLIELLERLITDDRALVAYIQLLRRSGVERLEPMDIDEDVDRSIGAARWEQVSTRQLLNVLFNLPYLVVLNESFAESALAGPGEVDSYWSAWSRPTRPRRSDARP